MKYPEIYREKARDAFDLHCEPLISNFKKSNTQLSMCGFSCTVSVPSGKMGSINGGDPLD